MITLSITSLTIILALIIFWCLVLGYFIGQGNAEYWEETRQSETDSKPTPQSEPKTVGDLKYKLEYIRDDLPLSFSLVCLSRADVSTVRRNGFIVCSPDDSKEIVIEII